MGLFVYKFIDNLDWVEQKFPQKYIVKLVRKTEREGFIVTDRALRSRGRGGRLSFSTKRRHSREAEDKERWGSGEDSKGSPVYEWELESCSPT